MVVHREDGEVLTGEAAERRAGSEPARAAREFKRRLGDPVPIIVGGTPYGAEALMAEMLAAIVGQVTLREGKSPTTIVLTHPANYSEYKCGLLREAARLAGLDLDRVRLVTEPEAAAIAYAQQQRIDSGEVIAVYDFGGGTFDAALVRDTPDGFELIGTPEGMERLGGIDFDQAVLAHVNTALGGLVSSADGTDPQVLAGQARLRDDCRRAKEALSNDTDATIAVSLPGVQTDVRLTRDELEQMVRPRVAETVKALQRTIASAGLTTEDVSRVLLVGGTSRMPIVAQIVRESIGRPVSVDADPKLTIAIGAALSAAPHNVVASEATVVPTPGPAAAQPTAAPQRVFDNRRRIGIAAALLVGVAAAAIIVLATRGDGKSTASPPSTTASTLATVSVAPILSTLPPPTTLTSGSTPPAGSTLAPAPAGIPQRLAFDGSTSGSGIPGQAVAAGAPGVLDGVAVSHNGDVEVIATGSSVYTVSGGQVRVAATLSAAQAPARAITVGADGTIFVSSPAGIVKIANGVAGLLLDGPSAGLSSDLGALSLDGGGNLFIADNGSSRIVRLAPDGGLTLVAGTGTAAAVGGSVPVDGQPAATSPIGRVTGLVIDRTGRLLIADAGLHVVRARRYRWNDHHGGRRGRRGSS